MEDQKRVSAPSYSSLSSGSIEKGCLSSSRSVSSVKWEGGLSIQTCSYGSVLSQHGPFGVVLSGPILPGLVPPYSSYSFNPPAESWTPGDKLFGIVC